MMWVYINSYTAAGWVFSPCYLLNISYKTYTTLLTLVLLLQALKLWQLSKQQNTWNELCKDDEIMEIKEHLQKCNGVVMCNQMYPSSAYSPPQNPRPALPQCLQGRLWATTKKIHLQVVEQKDLSRQRGQQGPSHQTHSQPLIKLAYY